MSIIEMAEKIAKAVDEKIDGQVVSAVVYGTEIHGDPSEAKDCNMVLVLDIVTMKEINIIHSVINEMMMDCGKTPLIIEHSEIEGMGDSVPSSCLDVLSSYQTVYGKSVFKGLSSISHEHLRAQVEQRIRESLFSARRGLIRGYSGGKQLDQELVYMKNLLKRSLHLYLILKKPWLTQESEKWDSFLEEFSPDNIWLRNYFVKELGAMDDEDKRNLAYAIVEDGIKPLLKQVDDMGPE
jgi:hypothetical protein